MIQATNGLLKIACGIGSVKFGAVGVSTGTGFTYATQISTGMTGVTVGCAGVNSGVEGVSVSHVLVRHDMSSVGAGCFWVFVARGVRSWVFVARGVRSWGPDAFHGR